MSIEEFIGAKISLISKIGIRYEGTLHSLNTDEATIILSDVRSMGTEGRGVYGEVKASSRVHDFIVFRGEDVKDLIVDESDNKSHDDPIFNDPAICKAYNSKDTIFNTKSLFDAKKTSSNQTDTSDTKTDSYDGFNNTCGSSQAARFSGTKSIYGFSSKTQGINDRNLESFQFDDLLTGRLKDTFSASNNFDYNNTNDVLTKHLSNESIKQTNANTNNGEQVQNKKPFYDNLSTNDKQLSKDAMKEERLKQKKIDIETFGRMSLNQWNNKRGMQRRNSQRNSGSKNDVQAGWEK